MSVAPSTSGRPVPAPPPAGREARAARREERQGWLLLAPALLALLAVAAFPLGYNIWNSFHYVDLLNPGAGQPFVGLTNYLAIAASATFRASLWVTVLFTVVSVAIEVTIGLALALALHQRFHGRGLVRAAILIPWAVPTVVSALLWKTMFDPQQGFVDYLLGLAHLPGAHLAWLSGAWTTWVVILVADAWKNMPFVALVLLAGLQAIPDDLYEAATIDGANAWQRLWRVTLPMLRPALLVALIFRTLSAFLIFDLIYIISGGGPGNATETLSYLDWHAFLVDSNFGYGGAVSVALIVFSLLIALAYVRLLRPEV